MNAMLVRSRFASCVLVAAVSLWMMACGFAFAESRVALVVGNSAYRNVPMLPNPTNDAGDVAASLERLGFAVTLLKDAGFDDLRHALIDFGGKAREADMAVVYFAGHGMEVAGENWLIPVDAELRDDIDTENESIGLKSLMLAVSNARTLGLVILDACRNDPFSAKMQRSNRTRAVSRGLAPIEPADNVLVAYAAKDGTTATDGEGRNSPFTAALLKHMETPGLEINFLFRNIRDDVLAATDRRQQPFFYGSLSKDAVYLQPLATGEAATAPPKDTPEADEIAWPFLEDVTDVGTLRRFVNQFPTSKHRSEAERRIVALEASASLSEKDTAPSQTTPASSTAREQAAEKPAAKAVARLFQANAPQIEAAWSVVKTSADPVVLRHFADAFPNAQRQTIVKALGGAPGTTGVLRQLRGDQMHAVLSDYGTFVHHSRYGEVWVPGVTPKGWHPYEPCHWVNTRRLGWYYRDRTPWGAIVHHFGRWTHDAEMGWIWVPGVGFSPGWVVWRTGAQEIGWAPMPPVEDIRVISAEQFNSADFWIFMDVARFARACGGTVIAPAANVATMLRTTAMVRDLKAVSGITIVVLPPSIAGPVIDIDVAFDPWPAWFVGQLLVDWNWLWNAQSFAATAICPVPAAPMNAGAITHPPLPVTLADKPKPPLPHAPPPTIKTFERRVSFPSPVAPPPKRRWRRDPDDGPEPPAYGGPYGLGPYPQPYYPPVGFGFGETRGGFSSPGQTSAPSGATSVGRGAVGNGRR